MDDVANGRRRKQTMSCALQDRRAPHRRATPTEDRNDGVQQSGKEPTTYRKGHNDGEVAEEDWAMERWFFGVDGIDGDGNGSCECNGVGVGIMGGQPTNLGVAILA